MKINEKLYRKYGTNAVILPPPPEEEEITEDANVENEGAWRSHVSPFLSQFTLEEGDDALDPEAFEKFEPNSLKETLPRYWQNEAVLNDLEKVKMDLGGETKAPATDSTIPPQRRAHQTSAQILKLCNKYYDLCRKF